MVGVVAVVGPEAEVERVGVVQERQDGVYAADSATIVSIIGSSNAAKRVATIAGDASHAVDGTATLNGTPAQFDDT